MPSCVVKSCKNSSKSHKKYHGITFHLFPTNNGTKTKWIEAIRNSRNDPEWLPSKSSVVCSDHFDNDDLYTTNRGLRRVTKSGYPKKDLHNLPDAAVDCTVLSSASPAFVSDLPNLPDAAVDCTVLPSASSSFVSDLPDLPNTAVDYTVLPSASSAISPVSPVSPAMSEVSEEDTILFDTPRKHKMRQKLNLKDRIIRNNKKKIKHLQQRVRRLKDRNECLKDIIGSLKKKFITLQKNYNRENEFG